MDAVEEARVEIGKRLVGKPNENSADDDVFVQFFFIAPRVLEIAQLKTPKFQKRKQQSSSSQIHPQGRNHLIFAPRTVKFSPRSSSS